MRDTCSWRGRIEILGSYGIGLFSKRDIIYNPGLIDQMNVYIHLMYIIPNTALQQ